MHQAMGSAELPAAGGCLAECFRAAALRHPGRIAVHDDDAALCYPELAGMAGGIARGLAAAGQRIPAEGCRIPLPTYPFSRRRHWIEPS